MSKILIPFIFSLLALLCILLEQGECRNVPLDNLEGLQSGVGHELIKRQAPGYIETKICCIICFFPGVSLIPGVCDGITYREEQDTYVKYWICIQEIRFGGGDGEDTNEDDSNVDGISDDGTDIGGSDGEVDIIVSGEETDTSGDGDGTDIGGGDGGSDVNVSGGETDTSGDGDETDIGGGDGGSDVNVSGDGTDTSGDGDGEVTGSGDAGTDIGDGSDNSEDGSPQDIPEGEIIIQNIAFELCLDASEHRVRALPCDNSPAQTWVVEGTTIRNSNGNVMDVQYGCGRSNYIITYSANNGQNQRFEITSEGIILTACSENFSVQVDTDGVSVVTGDGSEPNDYNQFSFSSITV